MNSKITELLDNLDAYYNSFLEYQPANSPLLHFHQKAVNEDVNRLTPSHAELLYAAIALWVNSRVGQANYKIVEFEYFKINIERSWNAIKELSKCHLAEFSSWDKLESVFNKLKITYSEDNLMANSMLISHLLPHISPPIDRKFLFNYLLGYLPEDFKSMNSGEKFVFLLKEFYQPLTQSKELLDFYHKYNSSSKWNTCLLQFVDNLIIGAIVNKRRKEGKLKSHIEPIRDMIFIAPF
ncbi:MAG: hypothetical protein ACEPOV_06720 [Hyphomicrobiales bacterium]